MKQFASARRAPQRGIALIMVLGLLALLTTVVIEFQYHSRVNLQLAYGARDALQAEYNALSALRMRAMILKQARQLEALVGQISSSLQAAGGGAGGAPPPIGAIIDMIPVECSLMSSITKRVERGKTAGAAPTRRQSESDSEDFFPGDCMATSQSEHSKIAINLLALGVQRAPSTATTLLSLLSDARLRRFFENDNFNGQHADSPRALLGHIADWVDSDHTEQENLGDEDRYYQLANPPYRAKNAPFDSVAELQLVYGIGDGLYAALKDRVSVYTTDGQLELPTASVEMVLAALPAILKDGENPQALLEATPALAARLQLMKQLGNFVPLSISLLQSQLNEVGLGNLYDVKKLAATFSDRSTTTWYTILAQGQMGRATRKIRAVFQATEGNFYYVRVE